MSFTFIEDEEEVHYYCPKHTVYRKKCPDCVLPEDEQHCECYECPDCPHEYVYYCNVCDPEEQVAVEVLGSKVTFEDEVPDRRTLADPEVKAKAAQSRSKRSRSTKTKDYAGKRADGWSYCCAHKEHLPNLCEREQAREGLTCTCPCHEERGFILEDAIRRYEDEEVIDLFD